jgi:4-amino-4-deoxy-L-arabinose transferase-like glycosyltransferase
VALIGVRAVAALALGRTPVGLHDPLLYQRFAQGIAKGQGYVSFNGEPTAYYPPGYPLFLGAVQRVCDALSIPKQLPVVAGLVQAVLGGLAVWAVVGFGDRVGDRLGLSSMTVRLGIVAGWVLALWPNLVLHSAVLLSESLLIAVFACFLLVMVRALDGDRVVDLLGAGLLLGLAALVRPQVVLVFGGVVIAALFVRRGWRQRLQLVALPLVGLVVAVVPWTIRNTTVFDELVAISTNGGDNLCVGFHPGATGHFEIPKSCDTGEFYIDGPAAEARRNDETSRRARDWATNHLGDLPALSLRKLYYTYEHDHDALRAVESYEEDRFLPGAVRGIVQWTSDLFYAVVIVAAIGGFGVVLRRTWQRRREAPSGWFVVIASLASAFVPVLFFGETRFKVPTTPLFAVLAAAAFVAWRSRPAPVPEAATVDVDEEVEP